MAITVPTLKEGVNALKTLLEEQVTCTGPDHHPMKPGQKFCTECPNPASPSTLTDAGRIEKLTIAVAAMMGAMGELAEATATESKKDDVEVGKRIGGFIKNLTTLGTPVGKKK